MNVPSKDAVNWPGTHQRYCEDPEIGRTLSAYMRETNGGGSLESVPGFGVRRAISDRFDSVRLPVPAGYGLDTLAYAASQGYNAVRLGLGPTATDSILPPNLRPPQWGAGFENVIGADERVLVPDTATIPWRCVCHLEVIFRDGQKAFGTGWLAGPDTVITAAHCVWDPRSKAMAAEIRVTPGRNAGIGPYGQFVCHEYAVMKGWPDPDRQDLDIAAITLPRDSQMFKDGVGARLGYFGVAAFETARLRMLLVNTTGYPVEAAKPFGTQWYNAGRIKDVEKHHVTYMIDTEGGQSGSPIFFYDAEKDDRQVVAIHTIGHYPNRGVRITDRVFDAIRGWIETPPKGCPAGDGKSAAPARRRSKPKGMEPEDGEAGT